jgi:hypothetical protein
MTEKDLLKLNGINKEDLPPLTDEERARVAVALPERVLPETLVPEYRKIIEGPTEASPELLMKLGALPPATPRVSDSEDVIVDGTGVQQAIQTAANVVNAIGTPSTVPGTMVQTNQGPMFQPNPTTVTVVPPAKSIQVVGAPEDVVADEDLGVVGASTGIPQILPSASQQPLMQQPVMQQPVMQQPVMQQPVMQQPVMQQGGYMPQMYQGGNYNPVGQGLNMSQTPAVYAASQPQPAQLYTSGVPGVPPTISVSTDLSQMGGFMSMNAPKPMRNNITLKRKSVQFGGEETSSDPGVKINVIKGS